MPGFLSRRRRRRGGVANPTNPGGQLDFGRAAASGFVALVQEL